MGTLGRGHRCLHDPGHLVRVRGRAARKSAEHELHENGPRIVVPLLILGVGSVIAGFVNIPDSGALSWVPEGWRCASSTSSSPRAATSPRSATPSSTSCWPSSPRSSA
ncbi:MAG: hypothetical protein R2711_09235 [Acidimicrobiales bacterium]